MADEPISNAELARRLDDRVGTLRDDIHDLKTEVAKLVPRELYDAHRSALESRVTNLEASNKALDEKWRSAVRWVAGAVAFPLIVLIIQILLSTKGVKP